MKIRIIRMILILVGIYLLLCGLLYFFQEKFIFIPEKLDKNYQFEFAQDFEELNTKSFDGKTLNGLLFKVENPKGLIFFVHGNAGSLAGWGGVSTFYNSMNYDVFIFDYRGFGKSEGKIYSQEQLFKDNQILYDELKKSYDEDKIIIIGNSIGSGLAAKLASENNPRLLVLQAPYYKLGVVMRKRFPIIPPFLLKYKLETNKYLKDCKMPVMFFHGDRDEVIPYESVLKLKEESKPGDVLFTLKNHGHNGISDTYIFKKEMTKVLTELTP